MSLIAHSNAPSRASVNQLLRKANVQLRAGSRSSTPSTAARSSSASASDRAPSESASRKPRSTLNYYEPDERYDDNLDDDDKTVCSLLICFNLVAMILFFKLNQTTFQIISFQI